jgi:hypothetical protein
MTKEEIIRMAREAGFRFSDEEDPLLANHAEWQRRLFERFANHVAAAAKEEMLMAGNDQWLEEARKAEREACAKVCESLFDLDDDSCSEAEQCAAAIRARGQA